MALCRNVRMSVPYIFDRTWRRSAQTETVVGLGAIAVMRKIVIVSLNFLTQPVERCGRYANIDATGG